LLAIERVLIVVLGCYTGGMAVSFYFYDLETSGLNPREARIMQFAGQRTDMQLKPIGEPHNSLIALAEDVLPDPDAILVTGITPQQTIAEGLSEAAFLEQFYEEITLPDTIFVGYNTVRFDDEFMRYLNWRNFYDAYEWQWQDHRSRWDLLDVVRMTRALRPDGIQWPFDATGKPTNRLELITKLNGLDHETAHDALSDVLATIAVAKLLQHKQPKLFEYLLGMRDKRKVTELVSANEPFVYTSGKYPGEFEKTTAVVKLADHPKRQGALVYDLRHDPSPFLALTAEQLVERWQWQKEPTSPRLPVKSLRFNACPAIAPLSVLDAASQQRLKLSPQQAMIHLKKLRTDKLFVGKLMQALEIMDKQQQTRLLENEQHVDGQLYDGFLGDTDRTKLRIVRAADPKELTTQALSFSDKRLVAMLPLYKARNFPKTLDDEERLSWERYREQKLVLGGQQSRLNRYMKRLAELDAKPDLTGDQRYLLEELQLYAQSIMPADFDG
jgi:exodeoxyribonuclease-1